MPQIPRKTENLQLTYITDANRKAWNQVAVHHRAHPQFQALLSGFRKGNYSCLDTVLRERLLAVDIVGRSVVQLCCNNGRDILSVKNLGAGHCLGIDQSAEFIAQARELSSAGSVECEFICTSAYEPPDRILGQFDLALITIGVLGWMPDLGRFFNAVTSLLRSHGTIAIYEDHPITNMFDYQKSPPCLPSYSYFDNSPTPENCSLDYFGGTQYEAETHYWTAHKLSDILMVLIKLGFRLEVIEEFPHDIGTWAAYENQDAQLPLSIYIQVRRV